MPALAATIDAAGGGSASSSPASTTTIGTARLHRWPDIDALAAAVADCAHRVLQQAIDVTGRASLVVSGGSTPRRYLPQIAARRLDWSKVTVTLADERWVANDDVASNERLIRETLLTGNAAAARFVSLKYPASTPREGARIAAAQLQTIAHPYDLVLLGMGDDGHFASLFPSSPASAAALDPGNRDRCVSIEPAPTTTPSVARVSLTLTELLDSRHRLLILQGETKWVTLQAALEQADRRALPITALLHADTPTDVHWTA